MFSKRASVRHLALLLTVSALVGCQTANSPAPTIELPQNYTRSSDNQVIDDLIYRNWWENFQDRQLTALMQEGLEKNLNLRQAVARMEAAYAGVKAAGGRSWPTLTAELSSEARGDGSLSEIDNSFSGNANAGVSWELDLFGRNKKARASAEAQFLAASANVRSIRLAYQADLASTYIDYQYFHNALTITKSDIASQRKTLALTEEMRTEGIATTLDVAQARALVDSTRAQLPALEKGLAQSANHIATLLGTNAISFRKRLPKRGRQPLPTNIKKIGIPADLLRFRPDVQREEFLLASELADLGVAEAELYPTLTLAGTIDIARLITSGATGNLLGWSFGPSIFSVLFDGGRLRANVETAKAEGEAQYLNWKQTVLAAVEEVENALVAVYRDEQEMKAYERIVSSYETTQSLATEAFKGGTGLLLDVLSTQRSSDEARLALTNSRRNLAKNYIALQVAVGAGAAVSEELVSNGVLSTKSNTRLAPLTLSRETVLRRTDPVSVATSSEVMQLRLSRMR